MNQDMLTVVAELHMPSLPSIFDASQLQGRANAMLRDLSRLLNVDSILQHTALTHGFRLARPQEDTTPIMLVIGLVVRPQTMLDLLHDNLTLGALQRETLKERRQLLLACLDLPVQHAHATIALAQRLQAGFLDLPDETLAPDIERQLTMLVSARRRTWIGQLAEHDPWQLELPSLPRYEWHRELIHVRAKLRRERNGFSLKFLRRHLLPALLRSIPGLQMPHRPPTLEAASELDRAEYTGTPLDLVIRVGSLVGKEEIVVADFIRVDEGPKPMRDQP